MIQNKTRILSTRPLGPELAREAAERGILLESLAFIETSPVVDEASCRKIAELVQAVPVTVFTSMNAVDAVAGCMGAQSSDGDDPRSTNRLPRKIFCIGSATRQRVLEHFGKDCIAGTADSAAALAEVIIGQETIKEVAFFCGDQRRDELPAKLWEADIRVKECIVYQTRPTPHTIREKYDGVVFFSPSAVNSFFSANLLPADTVLFAIGQTTADTIRSCCINPVIISDAPGKEALIRQAIDHFQMNV